MMIILTRSERNQRKKKEKQKKIKIISSKTEVIPYQCAHCNHLFLPLGAPSKGKDHPKKYAERALNFIICPVCYNIHKEYQKEKHEKR